ncbi:hypothetical protein AAFF_G00093110 [Aldrovandia affinis]|uniref:Uncharacterized protein n=1 Tax=Aldrovandia affinis TaxID=143900 RepID=A0AAD7T2Q3_9TELE|nr:hypothetical protein AAFF_G00093110 [Aldrovandia affinis]
MCRILQVAVSSSPPHGADVSTCEPAALRGSLQHCTGDSSAAAPGRPVERPQRENRITRGDDDAQEVVDNPPAGLCVVQLTSLETPPIVWELRNPGPSLDDSLLARPNLEAVTESFVRRDFPFAVVRSGADSAPERGGSVPFRGPGTFMHLVSQHAPLLGIAPAETPQQPEQEGGAGGQRNPSPTQIAACAEHKGRDEPPPSPRSAERIHRSRLTQTRVRCGAPVFCAKAAPRKRTQCHLMSCEMRPCC